MTVALHGESGARAVAFARQINLALVVLLVFYGRGRRCSSRTIWNPQAQ